MHRSGQPERFTGVDTELRSITGSGMTCSASPTTGVATDRHHPFRCFRNGLLPGRENLARRQISPTGSCALHPSFHRSEEHTSELQSLMRISYAVFCLKKKTKSHKPHKH